MLNTHSDRVDYRELLSPPVGYKTVFAVGTTYSLDLETLTAVCAIVGLNIEPDSEIVQSPMHMLEALRRASGKLIIFCQGGQIKALDKPNRVLSLLESCVCEINLRNKKSFHPKCWFIKYENEKRDVKYKMVVLSRNMTFDRSWDIAACLESADKKDDVLGYYEDTGDSIRNFLVWLSLQVKGNNQKALLDKKGKVRKLGDALSEVEWKSLGKAYTTFDFLPYGIGETPNTELFDTFHELFVISPFLSKSTIEAFDKKRLSNADCTLITRKSELPKLNKGLLETFSTYTVKDDVVDGEEFISEDGNTKTQDIHAKVYLRTKYPDSVLYLGSANASVSAFNGNVECLLALYGKRRYLNVDNLAKDLFGNDNKDNHYEDKSNPFKYVIPQDYTLDAEDEAEQKLEQAIKEYCAIPKTAVVKNEYDIHINSRPFNSDVKIYISPLMKSMLQPVGDKMVFAGLKLIDLSEWYIVTARQGNAEMSRVIKIITEGIPTDERDSAVFASILKETKDKNAFLNYIAFLLSDDFLLAYLESLKKNKNGFNFFSLNYDAPILYERMLKAVASSPDCLREIKDVIRLAGEEVVPREFKKLYEQFEKVVGV